MQMNLWGFFPLPSFRFHVGTFILSFGGRVAQNLREEAIYGICGNKEHLLLAGADTESCWSLGGRQERK